MTAILTFNKPSTNIQRAFGLFALLQKEGFEKGQLNPAEPFIIIKLDRQKGQKSFYSAATPESGSSPVEIPTDYEAIIKQTFNL